MRCRSHLQKYSELIISISGLSMFNEEALKLITKKISLINDELLTCLFWGCGDFNWNLWSGLKVEVTEIISVSVYCLISCSIDWQRQYRGVFRIQFIVLSNDGSTMSCFIGSCKSYWIDKVFALGKSYTSLCYNHIFWARYFYCWISE